MADEKITDLPPAAAAFLSQIFEVTTDPTGTPVSEALSLGQVKVLFDTLTAKGDLTAGSTKITVGGTGTAALFGAGASIDVNESNLNLGNMGGVVALASQVSGVLGNANGGTGISSWSPSVVIFANLAGAIDQDTDFFYASKTLVCPHIKSGIFQTIGSSASNRIPYLPSGTDSTFTPLVFSATIATDGTFLFVPNAAADGATKGAATFTAADFNASSGLISIDYVNGQAASSIVNGFLSSTDWSTFNGKQNALSFGDLTSGSSKLSLTGTGTGALIGAGVALDVVEANLTHNNIGGTLGATKGGTGLTAFTTGDIVYGSATNTLSALAGVATGNALISGGVGTAPAWGKIGLTTHVSGVLAFANGGTGASSGLTLGIVGSTGSSFATVALDSPLTFNLGHLGIQNASADGTTRGAATFKAADFNSTAGLISIDYANGQVATTSLPGFLSAADWTTFNAKQSALTFGNLTETTSSILTIVGGTGAVIGSGVTIAVTQSDGTHNGFLSSTDWSTFNGKQAALSFGNLTAGSTKIAIGGTGTGALVGAGATVDINEANLTISNMGGTLAATHGGTGQTTTAVGDLIYGTASNTFTKLAAVATGNALISGGVTTAPSWGKIALTTHVSGTLPVANGGTGQTSYVGANALIYTTSTTALTGLASANSKILTSSSGGVPTWATQLPDHLGVGLAADTIGSIKTQNALWIGGGDGSFTGTGSAFGFSLYTGIILGQGNGGALFGCGRLNSLTLHPFTGFTGYDFGSIGSGQGRNLYFGGGQWDSPDANYVEFYTCPTYTETHDTGVLRMKIWHGGGINIGGTGVTVPGAALEITGGNLTVGLAEGTTSSGKVHIGAGTATAGTAPLKFTSGTNLTVVENGAFEYNGTNLFFTLGSARNTILMSATVTTEAITSDRSVTVVIAGTTYKLLAHS